MSWGAARRIRDWRVRSVRCFEIAEAFVRLLRRGKVSIAEEMSMKRVGAANRNNGALESVQYRNGPTFLVV